MLCVHRTTLSTVFPPFFSAFEGLGGGGGGGGGGWGGGLITCCALCTMTTLSTVFPLFFFCFDLFLLFSPFFWRLRGCGGGGLIRYPTG